MNMINKIGLLIVILLGTIVYCKLEEKKVCAQVAWTLNRLISR